MTTVDRILHLCVLLLALCVGPWTHAQADGDGSVTITGELKQWHKVTLTIDGPFARETDTEPNPFTDYRLEVVFTHIASGTRYTVPGYFAADGNAGQTSASEGNQWRAHFSPDRPGSWTYAITFVQRPGAALLTAAEYASSDHLYKSVPVKDNRGNDFEIAQSDKSGRDLRAHGRLTYVGERYLRFAGSGAYFLKAGADAPETLLAYADFDGTIARKKNVPLKHYADHVRDWKQGDPTWQTNKGKGLIGAINYLASTGCNAFSFLTYNAGGDGDNVWPFVARDDKMHYDCSKLDQWQIVFDHATTRGMFLHFKLQETENDDNNKGPDAGKAASLDAGDLGQERKLYLRELVARYGYLLALNWNLGEENTQSTQQQRDMADYLRQVDPYDHPVVLHTYPNEQEKVYRPLLGKDSVLAGLSLQNSNVRDCHAQTSKWVERSEQAGHPWVVSFDEPGDASYGTPPDPDYPGVAKVKDVPLTIDDVRKHALWGTLMAGGEGIEYYFGYKLPQNDLVCEDWRSRAKTWKYSAIALAFFRENSVPFWEMDSSDDLIGAAQLKSPAYCFAKPGELYLVYLHEPANDISLDVTGHAGAYRIDWFNPRAGGELIVGAHVKADKTIRLGAPPTSKPGEDWLAVLRKIQQSRRD